MFLSEVDKQLQLSFMIALIQGEICHKVAIMKTFQSLLDETTDYIRVSAPIQDSNKNHGNRFLYPLYVD